MDSKSNERGSLLIASLTAAGLAAAAAALFFHSSRDSLNRTPAPLVAVVDTGLNPEELPAGKRKRILPPLTVVGDNARDQLGHGTAVARAVLEHCHRCRVLSIKVTTEGGAARPGDVAQAFELAKSRGARVVNFSLGLSEDSASLRKAVNALSAESRLLVTAAGVGILNPYRPMRLSGIYPQAYADAIVVGSVGEERLPDTASNYGEELDFVVQEPEGSSFAAAQVSGRIADILTRSGSDGARPGEIRHLLRRQSEQPAATDFDRLGYGILSLSPDGYADTSTEGFSYRLYPTEVGTIADLSFSSELSAGRIAATDCPRARGVQAELRILKKGRARLLVDAPSEGQIRNCQVTVVATFESGDSETVTVAF